MKDVIGSDAGTSSIAPTVDHLFSLVNNELRGDKFVRIFMLITLAIFLCPTSYGSASAHYYSGIASMEDISKYDWSSFVLDWLVTSIKKFQDSAAKGIADGKGKTSSLGNCLFILAVTYFEYIKTQDILLCDDIPRLKVWDDQMIQEFLALDGNSGDGRDFGMLELKDSSETPFLVSSTPSSSFSKLLAEVEDFILRLMPHDEHQKVRKQMSDMCRSFYKDLMGSALAAIQPVIIRQMCRMAQVMCDGIMMNNSNGNPVQNNAFAQSHRDVSSHSRSVPIQNISGVNAMFADISLGKDTAAHPDEDMFPKTKSPLKCDNISDKSPSTIQCAQRYRYKDPESTSKVNFNGAVNNTDNTCEKVFENEVNVLPQGLENSNIVTNANVAGDSSGFILKEHSTGGEQLPSLSHTCDTGNNVPPAAAVAISDPKVKDGASEYCPTNLSPTRHSSQVAHLKNVTKAPRTPVDECGSNSQLYMDMVVPDSFDRSSNAVRKTTTQLFSAANAREDTTSANNGPKKKRRLGTQNHREETSANSQAEVPQTLMIDVASGSKGSEKGSASKKRSSASSPASPDMNNSSSTESDEDDIEIILSDKFTRRRAIRLPKALASPSVSLELPRQKIMVSKFESDLYYLATTRVPEKVKSTIIAQIGRFHIDQRLFGDSLRPRKRVGTFLMNVFCEACNMDQKQEPKPKPSKCFITSDAVDKLKSKKATVDEAVEKLSIETTGLSIGDFNMVMIPMCHSNHWWVIVANMRDHRFDVLNSWAMDSSSSIITEQICDTFRKVYHTMVSKTNIMDKKGFPVHVQPAPMQETNYDCGVYAMKFLQTWDGRKLLDISKNDIGIHRQKIASYILAHECNVKTIEPVKKLLERDK